MSDRYPASALTRRRLLETAGATAAGFAGWLGSESDDPKLEGLHDWTTGPEQEATMALIYGFETAHPAIETDFRTIAVGGNTTYEEVVSKRLDLNDPPSSFAARAGGALARYEGYLGDAGDEALRDGALAEAHVDAALEHCRYDGRLVAVPLSVHRTNCLFYGVDVVEEAGVDPDALSTPADLLDALDRVDGTTDTTPMVHGKSAPKATLQLITSVLLGQSGADAYAAFLEGDGGEEAVRRAVETTERILSNHIDRADPLEPHPVGGGLVRRVRREGGTRPRRGGVSPAGRLGGRRTPIWGFRVRNGLGCRPLPRYGEDVRDGSRRVRVSDRRER